MSAGAIKSSSPSGKALVVRGVVHGLLRGRWQGGERLTEQSAAQLFEVSRTPVREAFLELEALGMLQLKRNCGAVLSSFGSRDLAELYSVRMLLELEAVRLAASRMDGGMIHRLLSEFEVLQASGAEDRDWALDRALHFEIAVASENSRLRAEINRYGTLVQIMREIVGERFFSVHSTSLGEHLEILHRLKARDEEGAVAAMRLHLEIARASALEAYAGLGG
jgi:DNA-binding GntR family transcriptional regulator